MEKSHAGGFSGHDEVDERMWPPIIDEMIKDIKASLSAMSTRQPIRGVSRQRNSSHQIFGLIQLMGPFTWVRSSVSTRNDSDNRGNYLLSDVLKSAKEKAGWAQLDPQPLGPGNDRLTHLNEAEELPVLSQVEDDSGGTLFFNMNFKLEMTIIPFSDCSQLTPSLVC